MIGERPSCTKCGRRIPHGETAEVTWLKQDEVIGVRVLCALHTDHDTAGTWYDK